MEIPKPFDACKIKQERFNEILKLKTIDPYFSDRGLRHSEIFKRIHDVYLCNLSPTLVLRWPFFAKVET